MKNVFTVNDPHRFVAPDELGKITPKLDNAK